MKPQRKNMWCQSFVIEIGKGAWFKRTCREFPRGARKEIAIHNILQDATRVCGNIAQTTTRRNNST